MANPFDQQYKAIICSYNFAAAKVVETGRVPWDSVVIDEAHRLRNVDPTLFDRAETKGGE